MFWPTTLFARYENVVIQASEWGLIGASEGDAEDIRVAAGFSSNLGNRKIVQWKFEVQHYLSATPMTRALPGYGRHLFWYTQLVLLL
jgi:hypothetical protein